MDYDAWREACLDEPCDALELCFCGALVIPDEPICGQCGLGEILIESNEEEGTCDAPC